jgi:hypothetical protein
MPDGVRQERRLIEPVGKSRLYTLCLFPRGAVVPTVTLIEASSDKQAIELANRANPTIEREIWDRHRLVAHYSSDLAGSYSG